MPPLMQLLAVVDRSSIDRHLLAKAIDRDVILIHILLMLDLPYGA
jgi:hypothetical protein